MEIEINFRFDDNGRTANTKGDTGADGDNRNVNEIDYDFRAQMTNLGGLSDSEAMDDILLDCEISDNMIMPRTYWMPADGTKARCTLEQLALDVFHKHVPAKGFDYDPETSGAEWWCQLRPSPEMGRHNAVRCSDEEAAGDGDCSEDPFANGISFHVDKDEELRILTGGSTYVHPHISTITYLTDLGSPTLIMDCLVHPLTGEWIVPSESVNGFVSWPSVGKHTSFDGRYLHASPPDLMGEKDAFQKQLEFVPSSDEATLKKQRRRHRRVTFLVNVWLNYKPYNVHKFPESMIDKMSGCDETKRVGLEFSSANQSSAALHVQKTSVRSNRATETLSGTGESEPSSESVHTTTPFSWPLGDKRSNEELRCRVPMDSIGKASKERSNVRIEWQTGAEGSPGTARCFCLCTGDSDGAVPPSKPGATGAEGRKAAESSTPAEPGESTTAPEDPTRKKRPRDD
ncbi:unnamed protein product [Pseudo-nitzschia multistriata]|uniref:Uncharacterized protein n=1 Tax=Pseudo-nitzschia multistriata TaxID=183589 RepID=A0A448ZMF5_9STRA|nr:unnamed protein product [Pseudo-nitzschia multistriata]